MHDGEVMSTSSQRPTRTPIVPPPGHQFIDHPSEARLIVYGGTLAALVAEAGRALAGLTLGEPLPKARGRWREVAVHSADVEALLVDWLNELIYLAESDRWMALEFDVVEATDTHVRARVRGVDLATAPSLVKAATHHGTVLEDVGDRLEARLVLDI